LSHTPRPALLTTKPRPWQDGSKPIWQRERRSKPKKKIQTQADRAFADLNTPLEQRGPDTRTDEQETLDWHFPAAKPEDYIIRNGLPGQEPEMTK
jgi:hypothetical protein